MENSSHSPSNIGSLEGLSHVEGWKSYQSYASPELEKIPNIFSQMVVQHGDLPWYNL